MLSHKKTPEKPFLEPSWWSLHISFLSILSFLVILFLNPKSLKCPIFFVTLHSQYRHKKELKNHEKSSQESKVVAAVTVIPHWRHSAAMLHTVLHPVVRPDAAAYQRRR